MKVPSDLDARVDAIADKVIPLLRESLQRTATLSFEYDEKQWSLALMAVTEKLPRKLSALGVDKDTKMEILTAIDILDRMSMAKGNRETAEVMLRSLVMILDLLQQFLMAVKLKVLEGGEDVTDEVFGTR